jgi:hypothetical protein
VRIVIAAVAALGFSVALLHDSDRSRGATHPGQPSVNVAVVPGFVSPTYPGYYGIPKLPVTDPQLSQFHFTAVPASQVNPTKLKKFDTVVLYGLRWSSLSASAQQAINTFAATGKVMIWDSDDTGSQNYATFIHPFTDSASGENGHPNESVVSFPGGNNFLASSNPSSPYFLDPKQLVSDRNMINDMNAMKTGTRGWTPALVGANRNIPQGGWVVAWAYGVVSNHSGMTIFSGIDADAFDNKDLHPNYSIKALRLQLAARFLRTSDTSCAPNCKPPGATGGKSFASCSFAKRVPRGWVHGRVPILMKASIAAGVTGKVLTRSGKRLAFARENKRGLLRLRVQTTRLPSHRVSRLRAVVYVHGRRACSKRFRLKVDNTGR